MVLETPQLSLTMLLTRVHHRLERDLVEREIVEVAPPAVEAKVANSSKVVVEVEVAAVEMDKITLLSLVRITLTHWFYSQKIFGSLSSMHRGVVIAKLSSLNTQQPLVD